MDPEEMSFEFVFVFGFRPEPGFVDGDGGRGIETASGERRFPFIVIVETGREGPEDDLFIDIVVVVGSDSTIGGICAGEGMGGLSNRLNRLN